MYRIVIIDDEPLIIAGIVSMIDWDTMGCEVVGKFANGAEAWKSFEKDIPDIVISDIKMPLLDGMELMKRCQENHLGSIFILLTNYEEFSLAQQAVKYGAADYLVKSGITPNILCRSLEVAINRCEKMRRNDKGSGKEPTWKGMSQEQMAKEYFRQRLLDGMSAGMDENRLEEEVLTKRFQGIYLSMFTVFSKGSKIDKKKMYYTENILQEMIQRYYPDSVLFQWDEDTFVIVLGSKNAEAEMEMTQMFHKIRSVVKNYFGMDSMAVVSGYRNKIGEVSQQFDEMVECMNYYYYDSVEPIVFYKNIRNDILNTGRKFDISFLKNEIETAIIQRDSDMLGKLLTQVRELFLEYKPDKRQAISACTNLYYYICMLFEKKNSFGSSNNNLFEENILLHLNKLVSLREICQWLEQFQKSACNALAEPTAGRGDWMVQEAVQYIEQHYENKLTLQEVSDSLGISSGYFSSLFSQKMGKPFSDYVNWVKIRHAKQLLDKHQYMVYEIADMLGFENAYYFSRVFKKVTGMTPTEYESLVGRK